MSDRPPEGSAPRSGLAALWTITRLRTALGVAAAALTILFSLLHIAAPFLIQDMVDKALPAQDLTRLTIDAAILLGVSLFQALLLWWRADLLSRFAAEIAHTLRNRMLARVQTRPLAELSGGSLPELQALFSQHIATLRTFLVGAGPRMLGGIAMAGVSVLFLFIVEWRLAIATLVGGALSTLLPSGAAKRFKAAAQDQAKGERTLGDCLSDVLKQQPVIRAFDRASHWRSRFDRFAGELADTERQSAFWSLVAHLATVSGMILVRLMVVVYGVYLTFTGQMSMGELLGFLALVVNVINGVFQITDDVPLTLSALDSGQRIATLLDDPDAVDADRTGGATAPPLRQGIRLDKVSFGYVPGRLAVEDLSLALPAKGRVALVGASGSGKSTLLSLLLGANPPESGQVLWDDCELQGLDPASLRARLAVVFQDTTLFRLTVAENIRMGRLDADDAQVERAARAAGIHEVIAALPEGYATELSADGGNLSGGQRQRIALARALVRSPDVLLLDEATSALDPETEAAIGETLKRLGDQCLVISVTHRLTTVCDFDQIWVLANGRVAEHGSHAELVAHGGPYATLFARQSGMSVSEDGRMATATPEWLATVPLLAHLDAAQRSTLAQRLVLERVAVGEIVIQQGDRGDSMYLIARGEAAVVVTGADGEEQTVGRLFDGDHFGELALLRDTPRMATVRARTDLLLCALAKAELERLLEEAPETRALLEAEVLRREAQSGANEE